MYTTQRCGDFWMSGCQIDDLPQLNQYLPQYFPNINRDTPGNFLKGVSSYGKSLEKEATKMSKNLQINFNLLLSK